MAEAWIIDACRTPRGIGKKGKGSLADQHPQHLGATVLKAIVERNGVNTAEVGDVIFGTSSQRGRQWRSGSSEATTARTRPSIRSRSTKPK